MERMVAHIHIHLLFPQDNNVVARTYIYYFPRAYSIRVGQGQTCLIKKNSIYLESCLFLFTSFSSICLFVDWVRNKRMEKSMYKASVSGSVEFLKKLIEEDGGMEGFAKAAVIGPFKETPPLHVAAMLGHLDFAKLLLRHLPNQLTPLDSQRRTPLHYAAAAGHTLVVNEILSSSIHDDDARTAIHVPDADGNTPLHLAIMNGHLGVVNKLVSYGALEVVGYGLDGRTGKCLLHFCVMYGRLEALKSLLESGEVKDDQVVGIKDGDGNTVLHLAAALIQLETIKYLLKNTVVRATVNTINGQGSTALDIAQHMPMKLDSKRAEIVEAISQAGGSSASNLQHPPQTINSGVGNGSKEMMISPEVEAGAVVLNLEQPPTPSRSPIVAKTPPKPPARSKSMEKQLKKQRKEKWREERINTLMISAILVSGVAYQGLLNPPGGALQQDIRYPWDKRFVVLSMGRSVMAIKDPNRFAIFLVSNTVSFLVSMATIMILMSGLKQRVVIKILSAAMWVTMSSLLVAYLVSVNMLTSEEPLFLPRAETDTTYTSVRVYLWVGAVIVVLLLALIMRTFIWCIKKVYNKLLKRRAVWCFRKSRCLFKRIGTQCLTYTCSPEKRTDNGDEAAR